MPDYPRQAARYCYPGCKFLRCQQKAIGRQFRQNNKMLVQCNFAPGALCEAYKCKYSFCSKYKMSADGRCMLDSKPQAKPTKNADSEEEESVVKMKKPLKIKSKVLKKLQEYEY